MTAKKITSDTQNVDMGVFLAKTRRVKTLPYLVGEMATMLKSVDGGDIITFNSITGETNIWNLEAGEILLTLFDQVLAGATIDGVAELTGSTVMLWGVTPFDFNEDKH